MVSICSVDCVLNGNTQLHSTYTSFPVDFNIFDFINTESHGRSSCLICYYTTYFFRETRSCRILLFGFIWFERVIFKRLPKVYSSVIFLSASDLVSLSPFIYPSIYCIHLSTSISFQLSIYRSTYYLLPLYPSFFPSFCFLGLGRHNTRKNTQSHPQVFQYLKASSS